MGGKREANGSSLNQKSILSNAATVDLHDFSVKFLGLIPSKISTEQTELLSNYDNRDEPPRVDPALVDRLFSLLAIVENFEGFFMTGKQILGIRDLLKEKKLDLKSAPSYINNVRLRFNRAQQKLVSILKFSSENFFRQQTASGELAGSHLYSNLHYVDYSPSRAQNHTGQHESDASGAHLLQESPQIAGFRLRTRIERVDR